MATKDPYSIIPLLTTPEECEQFAENVKISRPDLPDLPLLAKRRGIDLKAEKQPATTPATLAAYKALYAYEEFLTEKNGRKTSASRTRQMIKRGDILKALERAVDQPDDTSGFAGLREMGMEDLSFEKVVIAFESEFSPQAVARARVRLAQSPDAPKEAS